MNKLINNIRQWGIDKGITGPDGKGTVSGQIDKLREEYLEIVDAHLSKDFEGLLDGIGDCFVVLTLLAERAGSSIEECADLAYNVINKRTGKMVDGMFIKDEICK
jgi:NTP pyrophosphatase (non-canonical NTP hydrolase)